jgi:hypothetical protein
MYDVSDKLNPLKVGNIDIVNYGTIETVVHVDGNFLLVIAGSGYLFDISNPAQPVLIDENPLLSTNGISAMFDGHLYAVPQYSAGNIQDVYVNLAPQLEDMTINLDEDSTADITLPSVDAENDNISYSIITPPELGLLEVVEVGLLRYTPATDFSGVETAEVQGEDLHGGSSSFILTLQTKAINDAPQILDSVFTTLEDQILSVQIQASDVDSESLSFELVTTVLHGEVTLSESGELHYTPSPDFFGVDKLEVKVSDELNASSTKFIDLAVTPVNDLPSYTGETTILGDEDTEVNLLLSSVDIEGDLLEYSVLSHPDGWTVAVTDDSVVISPSQDDNGTFEILLGISDGSDTLEQAINVVLSPVNDAPTASQTNLAVAVVSGSNVSATLSVTDIDNDALSYVVLEPASKGTVSLTDSGFSYQSNAGHVGSDAFVIRVSDTAGEYVDVPVTVNVSAKVEPAKTSEGGGGSMNLYLACLLLLIYLSRLTKHQVCHRSH